MHLPRPSGVNVDGGLEDHELLPERTACRGEMTNAPQHLQRRLGAAKMTCRLGDWDAPGSGFTITATVAYVDTIRLFYRGMFPRDQLSWLRTRFGRRMILERWKAPGNLFRGGFVTLHQPDVESLERLRAIAKRPFVVNAVHIAVDFICPDQEQAKLAAAFLGRAAVQKWHRRKHSSHRERNTHYCRQGRSTRNIAVYGDREFKTGGGPCCHVEMRFASADACERAGLDLNNLLDGPDVLRLLKSQARIAPIDPKNLTAQLREKHAGAWVEHSADTAARSRLMY